MKKLKYYIIKFYDYSIIKLNIYFSNCIIWKKIYKLIIVITYKEYIFLINNSI